MVVIGEVLDFEWMCVDVVCVLECMLVEIGDDDNLIDLDLDLMCMFGLVLVWGNIGFLLEFL